MLIAKACANLCSGLDFRRLLLGTLVAAFRLDPILWQWRDVLVQHRAKGGEIRLGGQASRRLGSHPLAAAVHVGHQHLVLGWRRRRHRSLHRRESGPWRDQLLRDVRERAANIVANLLRHLGHRSDCVCLNTNPACNVNPLYTT